MKRGLIFGCLIVMSCLVTSCSLKTNESKDGGKKTNLVIIAGFHSNSKVMDIEKDLTDKIEDMYSNFGEIRVIVVDGNPEMAVGSDGTKVGELEEEYLKKSQEVKKKSEHIWERDYLSNQTKHFMEEFKKLEPDDSEVDTLEAIFKAVGTLNDISEDKDNKEILIYDTGLCTSGEFNFVNNNEWKDMLFEDDELQDEKIKNLIKELKHKDLIPDLSGIKVVWHGIGETAGSQGKLDKRYISNLTKMWQGILTASDAVPQDNSGNGNYFNSSSWHGETNYSQEVTPIKKDKKKDNGDNSKDKLQPTSVPVEKLGFKKESSKFISKKKAMEVLKPYAKKIKKYSNGKFLLIGTTSDPKHNGGSLVLSEKRAKKVKKILVQLGVSKNQLKIYGWAARSPLYDSSEWAGNNYKEEIAKKNRAVHLIPEKSDDAQKLLSQEHP